MDTTNPTARALLALELIQGTPGITAARLGERLGVSDRAARRYVEVLREAGIPVSSERGPYGGYRLGRGLRVPPLMFSQTEALGLVMAVLDGHHDAASTEDPVGAALGKIVRVLPAEVAAQAELVRRTAAPVPDRSAARPDPAHTTTLVSAIADRRRVRLGYRTQAGTDLDVEIDPWAVVVRHGRWYLLCHSHAADAARTYRVDRVTAAVPLESRFEPPDDLDPVADLEHHLAVGWEYEVEVVFEAAYDEVVPRLPTGMGRMEPVDDGHCRLVGSTSNPWMYTEWLAASPVAFHVLGGPELAEAVRVTGQRLLDAVTPGRAGPAPRRSAQAGQRPRSR